MDFFALLNRRANHAERGAVSRRRQRAGIAVSQHSAGRWDQRSAVASHGLVGGNVFGMHALRFFNQRLLDLRNGLDAKALKFLRHAADGPEKIYGRRARLADDIADLVELALQFADALGLGILHAERNAHPGSHANGGRAAPAPLASAPRPPRA